MAYATIGLARQTEASECWIECFPWSETAMAVQNEGETMSGIALSTLPSGVSHEMLVQLLDELRSREAILQAMIQRFEQRYDGSLEALEARLARGRGPEHPDWEDSIEWRNAVEALQRTRTLRSLLEWLLRSIAPSPAS